MMTSFRASQVLLGDAYHQLYQGLDTDEAELAAQHFSQFIELQLRKAGV
jgi:hypothetical protein